MNTYELTIVLAGEATVAKKKSVKETIDKMIDTYKGKIEKENDWGKIDLAYPILKQTSGQFLFFLLQLEPKDAKVLGDKLRLENDIIRYLLVSKEK